MTTLNPYITFNGNCREAMNFYKACFGGELTLQTVEGTPMEQQCPEGMQHQVMHSMLMSKNILLMGSDMMGKDGFVRGNTIALSVNCSSEEEIKTFFNFLSGEGKINDPLKEMFWGALYGCLTDKFGVTWIFNYDKKE
ncbi:VOC family protein [soil metagenome]